MRIAIVAVAGLALGGCAYGSEPGTLAASDMAASYSSKLAGKWLLYIDASALKQAVQPSDLACGAHQYSLDRTTGLAASLRETLPNVVEQVQSVDAPVPVDKAASFGARGVISVRGESVQADLHVMRGFLSSTIATDVDIAASVTIDGKTGRLLGETLEGHGHADTAGGFLCSGQAASVNTAADRAQAQLLRQIGEEIANADGLHGK
jgi:hypothetical protein